MRQLVIVALAGVLGAVAVAGTVQAQPYGPYFPSPAPRAYEPSTGRSYAQVAAYRPGAEYAPYAPYSGAASSDSLIAWSSVLGSAPAFSAGRPYDRYGYDPNGLIAADGHRIKCRNRQVYDEQQQAYVTRRMCR
ncbi:MAG: hypothetical protein ABW360_00255 [Phenylobacterium sp.]